MRDKSSVKKWKLYFCLLAVGCIFQAAFAQPESSKTLEKVPVQINAFKAESFAHIRQKYEGENYLVSLWSLTCPPCMKELEMLGSWQKENPGIPIVLIATDNIAESDQVSEILQRFELAEADNWIFADAFVEKLRYSIDPKWRGELPRTYLVTPESVRVVKGLLAEDALSAWAGTDWTDTEGGSNAASE